MFAKTTRALTTLAAVFAVAILTGKGPETARGAITLGFALPTGQRDVRVAGGWDDPQSNNNLAAHAEFPGWFGADRAIWKAVVEWGSTTHGTGSGDPYQPGGLGSGGADFDASWQGRAATPGGINGNIFSPLQAKAGGVYAFVESADSSGWRGRFYAEPWLWDDGPGTSELGGLVVDLQGLATHEYGHALGLNHSPVSSATMHAAISTEASYKHRTIASDDRKGVREVYGPVSSSKPRIAGISAVGGGLTIEGENFDPSDNDIWFTRRDSNPNGVPVKVFGAAAVAGGTRIEVSVPELAGPGDVLVKLPGGNSGAYLSNAWPFDPDSSSTVGPLAIDLIEPGSVDAVLVDPTGEDVRITGRGFLDLAGIRYDGVALSAFPPQYHVVSDELLRFSPPLASKLGPVEIELEDTNGNRAVAMLEVEACEPPVLEIPHSAPDILFGVQGLDFRCGAEPGSIYVLWLSRLPGVTDVPGLLLLDIGGGSPDELIPITAVVLPAKGWVELTGSFQSVVSGIQLHWQGAVLSPGAELPLVPSNSQKTILF